DCKGEDEDGDHGKAGVADERAYGVAGVLQGISPVIGEAFAAVHFCSYGDADFFESADVAELVFGAPAGCFGGETLRDEVIDVGFEVKAQFVSDVRRGIRPEQTIVAAPERIHVHPISWGDGGRVALSTFATAVA